MLPHNAALDAALQHWFLLVNLLLKMMKN